MLLYQALNTKALQQQYQHINYDTNLQVSHVLYVLETKTQFSNDIKIHKNIKIFLYMNLW